MSADLYERYRDALRTGHLAALRGAHEPALRAYRDAARLLPDRAAPHVAMGKTELAAGRPAEALLAFDAAVNRAPRDTTALDGAARALVELERGDDAAALLDDLATIYVEQDRQIDAVATLERAMELGGSPWRRTMLEQLRGEEPEPGLDLSRVGVLPDAAGDAKPGTRTGGSRAARPVTDEVRDIAERVEAASASGDVGALVAGARAFARANRLRAAVDACHDALTVAPDDPDVHRTLAAIYRRRGWQRAARAKLRIVERYQRIVDDPAELDRDAESALVTGDLDELLQIAGRHADQGRTAAALDLLFAALATAPSEPRLHLAIARLHLALGWRGRAVDELDRLARLMDITGDASGHEAVADFVNAALTPAAAPAAPAV
jgi:tetratricopeptide (TPR) repeat protein